MEYFVTCYSMEKVHYGTIAYIQWLENNATYSYLLC